MTMHTGARLLLADDEPDIIEILSYNLKSKGYHIATAANGMETLRKAREFQPDLILMDVMMPQKDGMQTLKELRQDPKFHHTIIILLTARNDEKSEIEGLHHGADDYIRKPLKPELIAIRIAAALRRKQKEPEVQKYTFDKLEIDKSTYTVAHDGKEILLPKKEFELLFLLASQPGKVFGRNEILSKVWGTDVIVGDRTIDVHIRKIRQKIGIDLITTVKGVGYKFEKA